MLWLLALHIAALALWSAVLLYLPALIASGVATGADSPARRLFTHGLTPAALLAIIAGTWLFLLDRNASPWLLAKLVLVCALVVCHGVLAVLLLRAPRLRPAALRRGCLGVGLTAAGLQGAIVWLVLAKPAWTS